MDTRSLCSQNELVAPIRHDSAPLAEESIFGDTGCLLGLGAQGLREKTFRWDGLTLVIRGYLCACPPACKPSTDPVNVLDRDRLAEELRWRYLEQGTLNLADLQGSATIVLADAQGGQVHAARTAGSPFPLFYAATRGRLHLSHNLALMARSVHQPPAVDLQAARTWIEEGQLPLRQTLFAGVRRLLPGERIILDHNGLQRDSFPCSPSGELTLAQLDAVIQDCMHQLDRPATVLTSRWSSAYLQWLRNRHLGEDELMPPSVSLSLDEPEAWDGTDWVMRLSQRLGTGHLLLAGERPSSALRKTLAVTAEPSEIDLDLFLSSLTEGLKHSGVRSVLFDWGCRLLDQEGDDQNRSSIRQAEHGMACLEQTGVEALGPFLDSRLPAGAELSNLLQPLLPHVSPPTVRGPTTLLKRWLQPGRPLAGLVEQLRTHKLMTPREVELARRRPTDRLARLVCYDQWHRLFVEQEPLAA